LFGNRLESVLFGITSGGKAQAVQASWLLWNVYLLLLVPIRDQTLLPNARNIP
jgi:hypothetical protein